jgi:hypothetical protein
VGYVGGHQAARRQQRAAGSERNFASSMLAVGIKGRAEDRYLDAGSLQGGDAQR